jgi:hypothetical protein
MKSEFLGTHVNRQTVAEVQNVERQDVEKIAENVEFI